MYITPAKNQQKYLRKVNGESLYAKTCYLQRNFNDLPQILNDNKIISSNGFVDKFFKKNSSSKKFKVPILVMNVFRFLQLAVTFVPLTETSQMKMLP